ncbi:TlyA family RNA methyltransferase [Humidisolicoccus flavus]|uniref:TlyA family RNA methyltransferase n=1 Tax=Humidisolicoccus flavus TaxID=3111414 RepID=UPI003253BF83
MTRLDAALAALGLARSRTHAQQLIHDGLVSVNGKPQHKSAMQVDDDDAVVVAAHERWVSRAALKLVSAFESFPITPVGALALDLGASTGGFTQVLLERGAKHVIALDVGHGQFALDAQSLPITLIEGKNVRELGPEEFAHIGRPTLVTADLSFISLGLVFAAADAAVAPDADWIVLVKPQFEVGRLGVKEGIVHDAGLRAEAIEQVLWAAWDLGLGTRGLIPSPITGSHGNREYLLWLNRAQGSNPSEWLDEARRIAAE